MSQGGQGYTLHPGGGGGSGCQSLLMTHPPSGPMLTSGSSTPWQVSPPFSPYPLLTLLLFTRLFFARTLPQLLHPFIQIQLLVHSCCTLTLSLRLPITTRVTFLVLGTISGPITQYLKQV